MNKKIVSLLFASTLALGACDNGSSDVTVEDNSEEKTEVAEVAAETETGESNPGNRSNPVGLGQTATQDFTMYSSEENYEANRSITVSNMARGEEVYNYLMDANQFNEEAPEGMEWVMVDVEYVLNEAETEDQSEYVSPDFKIIDSEGSQVGQDEGYPTVADGDEFGYVEVYSGGNASGKYVFYAPIDDEILLKYDDMFNSELFFDLK